MFRYGRLVFVLLLAPCVNGEPSRAQTIENEWHWVRVEPSLAPNPVAWIVLQGVTHFSLGNGPFTAELDEDVGGVNYQFILRGRISNNKIVATEIRPGTDAGVRTYHGFIDRIREPGVAWGLDRIVLTDAQSYTYIGILRSVQTDKRTGK